jgi:hypothetical protein
MNRSWLTTIRPAQAAPTTAVSHGRSRCRTTLQNSHASSAAPSVSGSARAA